MCCFNGSRYVVEWRVAQYIELIFPVSPTKTPLSSTSHAVAARVEPSFLLPSYVRVCMHPKPRSWLSHVWFDCVQALESNSEDVMLIYCVQHYPHVTSNASRTTSCRRMFIAANSLHR